MEPDRELLWSSAVFPRWFNDCQWAVEWTLWC